MRYASRKGVDITGIAPACKYKTNIAGTYSGLAGYVGVIKSGADKNLRSIWIPVDKGKFDYTMYSDELIAYEIINGPNIFLGSWSSGTFFSENADINIDFKPNNGSDYSRGLEYHDISIKSPAESLTAGYTQINDLVNYKAPAILNFDSLRRENKYYVPEYYHFKEMIEAHPEKRDSINAEMLS